MRLRGFFAVAGFMLATSAAQANSIIYSDFGLGNAFDQTTGWVVNSVYSPAESFTSPGGYSVSQIDVALLGTGVGEGVSLSLWTDVADVPGAQLGSWSIPSVNSRAVYTISGITGVNLSSGSQYFLRLSPLSGEQFAAGWAMNSTGATLFMYNPPLLSADRPAGAFDILGTSNVPEPLSLSLFGAGLFALGALRRRLKKAI